MEWDEAARRGAPVQRQPVSHGAGVNYSAACNRSAIWCWTRIRSSCITNCFRVALEAALESY